MGAYSISFTLGKASSEHGGNIQHNNRQFTAPNVDPEKEKDNIYYKTQDIREAYHNLFDEAVEEYNKKQTRPCRKIKNYFELLDEIEDVISSWWSTITLEWMTYDISQFHEMYEATYKKTPSKTFSDALKSFISDEIVNKYESLKSEYLEILMSN